MELKQVLSSQPAGTDDTWQVKGNNIVVQLEIY
jgi:hypothetical protein